MSVELLSLEVEQSKFQLEELEELASVAGDAADDLATVIADLRSLIALQEESLLAAKKAEPLTPVADTTTSANTNTSHEKDEDAVIIIDEKPSPPFPNNLKEGDKCCLPFPHNNYAYFLPSMILTLNLTQNEATVLPLTPITRQSRTCDRFLEGTCTKEDCGRSHGTAVSLAELLPMEVLDSGTMDRESKILALYKDGVYYPATIRATDAEKGDAFWVTYDGYGTDKVKLTSAEVLPIVGFTLDEEAVPGTVSSEGESDVSSDEGEEEAVVEDDDPPLISFQYDDGEAMGAWEAHTKGIGGRLLAKMGYRVGEGLGKSGEGIVRPVDATIVRPGAGLGHEELSGAKRKRKRHKDGNERRHKRQSTLSTINGGQDASNVFDFLNSSLNSDTPPPARPPPPSPKETPKTKPKPLDLNKQLLSVQERMSVLAQEQKRTKEGLQRNSGDKRMTEAYKEKQTTIEAQIAALRREEDRLSRQLKSTKQRKNMVVF
ncbi:hypothetical protein HK097_006576 [Rhizophlyctis rosea]|uniref:Zinc finger CCCH-type with G patch domain-containing protein n=1 Tax=Rhizophlyctis rosea TaxID=64517 RepID=A0AAD5X6E7_9FUNG|nr:hypothetical protein HK097_006576 [Rhizophlyctis rosea]